MVNVGTSIRHWFFSSCSLHVIQPMVHVVVIMCYSEWLLQCLALKRKRLINLYFLLFGFCGLDYRCYWVFSSAVQCAADQADKVLQLNNLHINRRLLSLHLVLFTNKLRRLWSPLLRNERKLSNSMSQAWPRTQNLSLWLHLILVYFLFLRVQKLVLWWIFPCMIVKHHNMASLQRPCFDSEDQMWQFRRLKSFFFYQRNLCSCRSNIFYLTHCLVCVNIPSNTNVKYNQIFSGGFFC